MPESDAQHGVSAAAEEPPGQSAKLPKRNRWRLRILLFITGLVAVLFVVSRLEPTQVAMLGPPGKYIHDLFNPQLVPETSAREAAHRRRERRSGATPRSWNDRGDTWAYSAIPSSFTSSW